MDAVIHVGREQVWEQQDTTASAIDRVADGLREEGKHPSVSVTMSRKEKRALNKSVRERDGRKCRKCGSQVDVKIVEMRYQEHHNPDHLVCLCRPCRRARPAEFGFSMPVAEGWGWVLNGVSGLDERADRYLSDPRISPTVKLLSMPREEVKGVFRRWLLESDFGLNPMTDWTKRGPSPHAEAAFREYFHGQEVAVPEAVAEAIANLDLSEMPVRREAIYHWVNLEAGETMQEALGQLDVLVARSSSKETPIYFDILGAPNREQFETAAQELVRYCQRRGYVLASTPAWEDKDAHFYGSG